MKKCCWLYANEKLSIYSACFIGKTVDDLIVDFNEEVEKKEITQDRIYYRQALLQAFAEKDIDVSEVSDGENADFSRKVGFDRENRRLFSL